MKEKYTDERNFFKIIEDLWLNKHIIISFLLAGILYGYLYIYNFKPTYDVKIPYMVNIYPPLNNPTNSTEKKDNFINKQIVFLLENKWNIEKKKPTSYLLNTTKDSLPNIQNIKDTLEKLEKAISAKTYLSAKNELAVLNKETNDFSCIFDSSDKGFERSVNLNKTILEIDQGLNVLTFGPISINENSLTKKHTMFFFVIISTLFGIMITIIIVAYRKHKAITNKV